MPRGDRTGPIGQGPMTGRGMGHCAGYPTPGYMNPGGGGGRGMAWGRGGGFGRGMAWGRGGGFAPAFHGPMQPAVSMAPADEAAALKNQMSGLEDALSAIKKRLAEIETEESK